MQDQDPKGAATQAEVHIVIDKAPKVSPNPTTGGALYALGNIQSGYELFREVRGKGDDEPVSINASSVSLKPGDHFYSAQMTLNPGSDCE